MSKRVTFHRNDVDFVLGMSEDNDSAQYQERVSLLCALLAKAAGIEERIQALWSRDTLIIMDHITLENLFDDPLGL